MNRVKSLLLASAAILAAATVHAQYDGLYITELINNPTVDEAVEIYNSSASTIDLSGVILSDEETSNNEGAAKFPAGTMIAAGEVIVVALNTSATEPSWLDSVPAGVRIFREPARDSSTWTAANGNTITALEDFTTNGTTGNIALSATDNILLLKPSATFSGSGISDVTLTIDGMNWDNGGPYGPINSTGQLDTTVTALNGNNRSGYPYHRAALIPNTNTWKTFVQDVPSIGKWEISNAAKIRNADWYEREIGENAYARTYRFDDLFGDKQIIHVAEFDQATTDITLKMPHRTGGARAKTSTFAGETANAAAAVNGNFFNSSGSSQYFKVDNVLINSTDSPSTQDDGGVVVDNAGDVRVIPEPAGEWESLSDPSIMATNVALVDGHIPTSIVLSGNFYTVDRHPRTAVGTTPDGKLLLVVVDGRSTIAAGMTLNEMARMMIALGCSQAVNMDGGGSATFWDRDTPGTGVSNIPSDGSERTVVNALAVVAPESSTPTPQYDARRKGNSVHSSVHTPISVTAISGQTESVTVSFVNTGTETWTQSTVFLGTSEPLDRASSLYKAGDWISASRATALDQVSVAPGATGTFTFNIDAPVVGSVQLIEESFALVTSGGTWFGPEQNRLYLTILPPVSEDETIIESYQPDGTLTPAPAYQETGSFSQTTSKSTVTNPPVSGSHGRYNFTPGSTATFRMTPSQSGVYNIYVTMGAGSNNNATATYVIDNMNADITGSVLLSHTNSALVNKWLLLESGVMLEGGVQASIKFTNVDGNAASGARFVMDAVRFERTGNLTGVAQDEWTKY